MRKKLVSNLLLECFGEEFVAEYKRDISRMFGLGTFILRNFSMDAYIDFGEISLNPHKLAVLTTDLLPLAKIKSSESNAKKFMDCIHKSLMNLDTTFVMEVHTEDAPNNTNLNLVLDYKKGDRLEVLGIDDGFVISNCAFSSLLVPNHVVAELPVELMLLLRVLQALTMKVLSVYYEEQDTLFSYYTKDTFEPVSKSLPSCYYIDFFHLFAPEERYSVYVNDLRLWFSSFSKNDCKVKDCNVQRMLLDIGAYMEYLYLDSKNSVIAKLYKSQI